MGIPRYNTSDFDPTAEFGFLQQNSVEETAHMHTHEFFEMFLVTDGQALHLVNDAVQNIQQGDLVLIRPDDCHCYDYYQSFDFRFINIAFSVETVVLLSKLNTKQHIEVELNLDELDLTSAESKATYDEIKAYVLEKHGLKVSSLYISQVKRKCGLDVGQNYNLSKKEDAKVPQCPPEKEAAIMAALKHFRMI